MHLVRRRTQGVLIVVCFTVWNCDRNDSIEEINTLEDGALIQGTPGFEGAIEEGHLRLSQEALGLVISEVDPGGRRIELLNRSSELLWVHQRIRVWTRAGEVRVPTEMPFSSLPPGRSMALTAELEKDADFVLVALDNAPVQYLEYGDVFAYVPARKYLWAKEPIRAPSAGEIILPAHPVFSTIAVTKEAYQVVQPSRRYGDYSRVEVTGRIVDTLGAPVGGATVLPFCDPKGSKLSGYGYPPRTVSRADGSFRLSFWVHVHRVHDLCWIDVSAPHMERNRRAFLRRAATHDVGVIGLHRYSDSRPGFRVADTRIEFGEGVFIEAAKEDLDRAGSLYFVLLDEKGMRKEWLLPGQPRISALVHGEDPTKHVRFETRRAHLVIPLPPQESAYLKEGESILFTLADKDGSSPPTVQPTRVGTAILTPSHIDFVVEHFSSVLVHGGWTKIVTHDLDMVEKERVGGACLCIAKNVSSEHPGGSTVCEFPSVTIDALTTSRLEVSEKDEASISGSVGYSDKTDKSPGSDTSLDAHLANEISKSIKLTQSANIQFSCSADVQRATRCHDARAFFGVRYQRRRLDFHDFDAFKWGIVENILEGGNAPNKKQSIFAVLEGAAGFVLGGGPNPVGVAAAAGGVLVAPQPYWAWNDIPFASAILESPWDCSGQSRYEYTSDYAQCGCEEGVASEDEFRAVSRPNDEPEVAPSCPGTGFISERLSQKVALGNAPQGCLSSAVIQALSTLCEPPLAAMNDDACRFHCNSLGCTHRLHNNPPPSAEMNCRAPTAGGEELNLECIARAKCSCLEDEDRDQKPDFFDDSPGARQGEQEAAPDGNAASVDRLDHTTVPVDPENFPKPRLTPILGEVSKPQPKADGNPEEDSGSTTPRPTGPVIVEWPRLPPLDVDPQPVPLPGVSEPE